MRVTLDEIGLHHGTDKATSWHGYTAVYERYFEHLRDEPITLLEYGVGGYGNPRQGGSSLRMWADYFPKATVIGIDTCPKTIDFGGRNVHTYVGDQSDAKLADMVAAMYGPLDIVIDDASHLSEPTIAAFIAVWPSIKPGGFYVCEDAGYTYPGAPSVKGGPLRGDCDPESPTAMRFFRRMADDVNPHGYPARYWRGYELEFAHFWRDLVILRKKP